jgi:hypothetical protein
MITVNMTNKFLKLNHRKRKKKINLMIRTMIQTALLHIGIDSGPVMRDTKRHFVPFATADISGKLVTFTFFDEP